MVAGILVHVTRHFALGHVWATPRLQWAGGTIELARPIEDRAAIVDFAGCPQRLTVRARVLVLSLSNVKSPRENVPSSRLPLSHTGMRGVMPAPTSQPRNLPVPYAVSAASRSGFKSSRSSVRSIIVLVAATSS